MMSPLWLLAVLSIAGAALGGAALGQTFPEFLGGRRARRSRTGRAGSCRSRSGSRSAGSSCAWLVYQRGSDLGRRAGARRSGPLPGWAAQGYGLDALYMALYRGAVLALGRLVGWIDRYLVDGLVNVASAATLRAGAELRRLQTGRAQDYLYGVTAGLLLVLVLWRLWA